MRPDLLMRDVWVKRVRRGAVIGGIAIAALMAAAVIAFVSPLGRNLVAETLMNALAGSGTARYETVSGSWPGTLVLSKITLADRDGPWLTLERATLDWRPLALLGGTLRITRLALDQPVLLRQPKAAEPGAPPPSSGAISTEPPLAVKLDGLTITDGSLQDQTEAIRFDGTGQLRWTRKVIALKAGLQRRGGADEHLRLEAGLDQIQHRVALNLDASSGPGGLFARLAGTPDLPAFSIGASGAGPAEAWLFRAAGSVGDYGTLSLNGRLAWTDRLVLDLDGAAKPGRALGQTWRDALGETLALKAHLARDHGADGAAITLSGEKAEAALDAQLAAPSLLGDRALQGKLRVRTSKPLVFGASAAAGPAEIQGRLGGTLDRPSADLTLALDGAHYGRYQLSKFDGTLRLRPDKGDAILLEGAGGLGALTARGGTVIEAARWSLGGVRDGPVIRDARLSLTSAALALEVKGGLDSARGAAALDATIQTQDLNAITPIAHVRLAGAADLALTFHRAARDADAPVTVTGTISHGSVAHQDLSPFGAVLILDAALTKHADGVLTMEKGRLTGDHLAASMTGRVDPVLDLPITLTTDLSALGAFAGVSASGKAEGRLLAQGTLDDPRLALDLTSRAAGIAGRSIGTLTIAFRPEASLPNGRVRLEAKGPLGGLDLILPVAEDREGLLVLGPMSGAAYGAHLTGTLHETRQAWTGRLDAKFSDLTGLYSLASGAPLRMNGRGTASVVLGPATDIAVQVALRDVVAESRMPAAAKLTLDASRKGNMARIALIGQELRLPGAVGPIDARRLALNGSGPVENVRWTVTGEGFTGPQGTFKGEGSFESKADGQVLALSALSGKLWDQAVALEGSAFLTLRPGTTTLSPLAIKIGTGRLRLGHSARGGGQKSDLALSAVPIAFIGRIIGADWPEGRITGQAGLDSLSARPSGFADLNFANALFSRQGQKSAEPLSGQLTARWDGRTLTVKGEADRLSTAGTAAARPIRLDGRLPLIRGGNGAIAFDPRGPVSGEVHWTGRLGTLWALLPYDLHRLDGNATMNGRASGRWGAPRLEGALIVENGSYESLMTGTRLTDITLSVDAGQAGGEAKIEGGDGRGGRFAGHGHVDFGEAQRIKAEMTLTRLRIVGLDRLTAEASGPLTLTGSLKEPLLAGKLRVDHVDATIPDRLPPSIPQLSVRYIDEADVTIPQFTQPETGANGAVGLSLDVDVPGQAFLRGRGLTSEWRGHVMVEGTSLVPRVKGLVELVRGQIAFAGRNYDLTRGRVNFDGSAKIDPLLDIAATRTVEGNEISLAVGGPSSAPRLDLTSSLPRDQAMSLFLFGKPAQSLTTLEVLDVARSVASLSGRAGGGFDPIEKTRRALGLDVLTVGVGGNQVSGTANDVASSTTLQAGRYVSKRVYLGVKQGAKAGSSAVQLNYGLTPHISAGTEVGVETGGQLNLNWKWDY